MMGQDGEVDLERMLAKITQEGQRKPASPPSPPTPLPLWHLVAEDGSTSPLQSARPSPVERPGCKAQQVDRPGQPLGQHLGSNDGGAASPPGFLVACPLSVEKGVPVARGPTSRPSVAMPQPFPRLEADACHAHSPIEPPDSRTQGALPTRMGDSSETAAGNPRWTADARLHEVVRAWSRLPEEIRNAIVSMIRSTRNG